jgi:pimeloyl-ACP methyl ester carboxylesterase
MSAGNATRAFYLTSGTEPIHALFDRAQGRAAPSGGAASPGVLLCPMFGNDDLCAYRARREWAKQLAAAGYAALRFDLPGTGDSAGGPYDPERLDAWTDALNRAAAWLREQCGHDRVSVVGIGLGGLLAVRAVAQGAPIDDLVLWSVPARGRALVRQLRALSRLEASAARAEEAEVPPRSDGALACAGFVLSAETVAALEALDITELELPDASGCRVLLLSRDGMLPDARLGAKLERSGATVTVAPGPGYGAMVTPPQRSCPPLEVFATVEEWLGAAADPPVLSAASAAGPPRLATTPPRAEHAAASMEMTIGGTRVRETPLTLTSGRGDIVGVLAEPEEPLALCAVLLNAGAIRRIGPGRMWVELARRWAAWGVPTLRVDLAGIGDADGELEALRADDGFYVPGFVGETLTVLQALAERGLPQRFVLAGLCSGAYWSMHAALEDERVLGAYMVNPRALFWNAHLSHVRNARNIRKAARASTWRKLMRGQITAQRGQTIARAVGIALGTMPGRAWASRRGPGAANDLEGALERLERSGTDLLAAFTAREPLLEELERTGGLARMDRRPNVRIERIPGPLASHTLEPIALQRSVHAVLDQALSHQLRRLAEANDVAGERAARVG